MRKARIFVLDSRNAKPIEGLPFKATATYRGQTGIIENLIGILSTDHKGYLSFAIPFDGSQTDFNLSVTPLFNEELSKDIWETINQDTFKSAIPFLINGSSIPSGTFNDSLPFVQSPDAIDWQLSPESFGSKSYTVIGQDGCESLLLSHAAVHTYRFSQLVRNRNEKTPLPLYKIKESQPCENEKGFKNFDAIFRTQVKNQLPGEPDGDPWYDADLTCYKIGALLEYEIRWNPINHGLGEVLYSLPLAPCESRKIAFIDWSREDKTYRTEDTSNSEQLLHNQRRDRIIDEAVEGAISEWQRGGSVMGGASFSGSGGIFSGTAAVAAGYSTSSGDRNMTADTAQKIADNVAQASSASRRFNSTVIVQASQSENQTLETRAVTNHNHCHSLTVMYYEIVRHFLVTTSLLKKNTKDVIFVRYPILKFDEKRIFENRLILKEVLLDKNLKQCLEVFEKVYCTDVNFKRHRWPTNADENELEELNLVLKVGDSTATKDVNLFLVTDWSVISNPLLIETTTIRLLRQDFLYSGVMPDPLSNASPEKLNGFRRIFGGIIPVDPTSATLQAKVTEIFTFKPQNRVQWKNVKGFIIEGPAGWIPEHIKITTNSSIVPNPWVMLDANGSIGELHNDFYVYFNKEDYAPNTPQDILSDPENCCKSKLIDHINQNLAYYNRMIWLNEDAGERAIRFDQFKFEEQYRLIDVIENKIVGVVGDYVAFPLTIGTKDQFANSLLVDDIINEQILSIPTRGAFAEAKLGHCNSCETRDVTKYWNWQESPCNCDPPEISNISPVNPARDTNVTPTMPAASLNIAAPNEEPDPAGIGAALNILGKSDIFRDMSAKEQVAGILDKLIDSSTQLKLQDLKNQGASNDAIAKAKSQNSNIATQQNPTPSNSNQTAITPQVTQPTPAAAAVDATQAEVATVENAYRDGATSAGTRNRQREQIANRIAGINHYRVYVTIIFHTVGLLDELDGKVRASIRHGGQIYELTQGEFIGLDDDHSYIQLLDLEEIPIPLNAILHVEFQYNPPSTYSTDEVPPILTGSIGFNFPTNANEGITIDLIPETVREVVQNTSSTEAIRSVGTRNHLGVGLQVKGKWLVEEAGASGDFQHEWSNSHTHSSGESETVSFEILIPNGRLVRNHS